MKIEELAPEHEQAFLAAMGEFERADITTFQERYARKSGWSSAEFKKFAKEADKDRLDWRPSGSKTSVTRYVMLAPDGRVLALGLMRFPLDSTTELDGGNLVCDVPPSLRRQGNGSYCLALMLFEAVRAGLRRVLVTCPANDVGARRMIEKNRGVLHDTVSSPLAGKKDLKINRYWISF